MIRLRGACVGAAIPLLLLVFNTAWVCSGAAAATVATHDAVPAYEVDPVTGKALLPNGVVQEPTGPPEEPPSWLVLLPPGKTSAGHTALAGLGCLEMEWSLPLFPAPAACGCGILEAGCNAKRESARVPRSNYGNPLVPQPAYFYVRE